MSVSVHDENTFISAFTETQQRPRLVPEPQAAIRAACTGPMIELLARLATDLPSFAPELISDPRVSLYGSTATRASAPIRKPLKTHVAAHFPTKGFARNEGAGLYPRSHPGGSGSAAACTCLRRRTCVQFEHTSPSIIAGSIGL